MTSYHHFRFEKNHPGIVFVREETGVTVINPETCIDPDDLPEIFPSSLSEQRKQYHFEQIRQFCDEKYRDITCPEPRGRKRPQPEPRGKKRPQPDDSEASINKSNRLCSHC